MKASCLSDDPPADGLISGKEPRPSAAPGRSLIYVPISRGKSRKPSPILEISDFFRYGPKEISVDRVLAVIAEAERHHRIVWTAGRVLKEDGSLHQVMTGDPVRRKALLRRLRAILKTLAGVGVLAERRGLQLNFWADYEVGYDLIREIDDEVAAADARDSQLWERSIRISEQDSASDRERPPN